MRSVSIIIFFFPLCLNARLRLAKIFSDNMVLQRDQPIHIWGGGVPGKNVRIDFGDQVAITQIEPDSTWSVELRPQKVNPDPQSLRVESAGEKIVLRNILIGDVWLCIGQSNMEWPMLREMHFKEEVENSNQHLVRFFNPAYAGKNVSGTRFTDSIARLLTINDFYKGHWQNCDSNTFKTMSAVAYYFGKQLTGEMSVPVGLINLSIGGAPLETFISPDALKNSERFSSKMDGDWLTNESLPLWTRERGTQNVEEVLNVPGDLNGKNHAYKPGFAYTSGIEPMLQMPIKGILCYQGESNAQEIERVNEYSALFALMVTDYRKRW
ncbi:MAG TPA: hypothetical protein VFP97_10535, partial [Chitinophagaceae bacterium]|nr:hypothetical protein [Chitinophagaceae bacterium]